LSVDDLGSDEVQALLDRSAELKADRSEAASALRGRSVALIFEKPSTRTRVSFEVAVAETGGTPIMLSAAELQIGRGETIEDTGRTLSRFVHAIVLRTFEQERLEILAKAATVPVINALSDFEHPCQVVADLFTVREHKGRLAGLTLAYMGDGNNVAHSLLLGCAKTGMHVRVATPPGYEPIPQVVQRAEELAAASNGSVLITHDPAEGTEGVDVLYTDVWASMGQEAEADERTLVFQAYRLDGVAVGRAKEDVIVMHCLPAHRGQEITGEVIDGAHSVVWDQAENRLHVQKALLIWALAED